MIKKLTQAMGAKSAVLCLLLATCSTSSLAAVTLDQEIHITDQGLYFNGDKKASTAKAENDPDVGPHQYDYMYGTSITPHGDCIKVYKQYVFMTWYRGGKQDRHLMLTRYDTEKNTKVTIEFPHRHTGYSNRWWIGETHNTIAIGLSPKNESIHMVFDQHSLSQTNPSDGSSKNDYFKYYYSKPNSLTVPDDEFTLDLFVKDDYYTGNDLVNPKYSPADEIDEYKHITLTGEVDQNKFQALSYPKFFLTDEGDLFLYMRKGRSGNGQFNFIRYDGSKWQSSFRAFNYNQAKSRGNAYDYGVYGEMKYLNGKIRMGFQQRINPRQLPDKYLYQNGFFGAYSDDPTGQNEWKNYDHELLTQFPVINTDPIKISEPGDLFPDANEKDQVYMVGGFDWTVTDNDDVHFIGSVKDNKNNITKKVHTYRKGGSDSFVTTTDFSGADELYAEGNDIYIIGLKNGRPNIERAAGGTNDFERIYAPTTGKTFSKGVPYITGGKLYYYLLESGSGDARPVHLQVINLIDLTAPTLAFTEKPSTLLVDYDQLSIKINAESAKTNGTISSVSLYLNDTLISKKTNGPYHWDQSSAALSGLAKGEYTIKAIVEDNDGDTAEDSFKINVVAPTPTIAFAQEKITKIKGYSDFSLTAKVNTPDPQRSITDVALFIDGGAFDSELVSSKTAAPFVWTQADAKLANLSLGSYTVKAIVTDNKGDTAEATVAISVVDSALMVAFEKSKITLTEGYDELYLDIAASSAVVGVTVKQVDLYIDGDHVRKEGIPPYEWGHTNSPNVEETLHLSVGDHILKAVVTDSNGDTAEATMLVEVNAKGTEPQQTPPTVSITATPATLTEGYSAITISATAAATTTSATIDQVALYLDGTFVSQDTDNPYQWTETSTSLLNLAVGEHTVKVLVTDSDGLTAEATSIVTVASAPVVDPTPPTVSFSQTPSGLKEGYSAISIGITANATTDSAEIAKVALYINDTMASEDSAAPYLWTETSSPLQGLSAGSYTIKAVVTDSTGLTAEQSFTLTIAAAPITEPTPDPIPEPMPEPTPSPDASNDADAKSGGSTSIWLVVILAGFALRRQLLIK